MVEEEALEGAVDSAAAGLEAPQVGGLDADEAVQVSAMPPLPDDEGDDDDP